jgi:hypothetical protein
VTVVTFSTGSTYPSRSHSLGTGDRGDVTLPHEDRDQRDAECHQTRAGEKADVEAAHERDGGLVRARRVPGAREAVGRGFAAIVERIASPSAPPTCAMPDATMIAAVSGRKPRPPGYDSA